MNNQNHGLLIQLGIPSFDEAGELEPELNVRFDDFTPSDVKVWQRQSAYLHHFGKTGSVTASAREAGVAVFTAQLWKSRDTYGFNRRLEVSELEYCERLEELALERATQPNAPVSLLIVILRARMPEKYGRKDSEPDKDKEELMPYNYTVRAQQEKADGYPVLQRIIQGDPDPFRDDPDREQAHANAQDAGLDDDPPLDHDEFDYFDLSTDDDDAPHPGPSPTGLSNPSPAGDDIPLPDLYPAGRDTLLSDLSPTGDEIQRGGSSSPLSAPSAVNPPLTTLHPVRLEPVEGHRMQRIHSFSPPLGADRGRQNGIVAPIRAPPLSHSTASQSFRAPLSFRAPPVIPSVARNLKSITARPDAQSHACIVTENQPGQKFSVSALRCDRHFRFFDSAAFGMTVMGL